MANQSWSDPFLDPVTWGLIAPFSQRSRSASPFTDYLATMPLAATGPATPSTFSRPLASQSPNPSVPSQSTGTSWVAQLVSQRPRTGKSVSFAPEIDAQATQELYRSLYEEWRKNPTYPNGLPAIKPELSPSGIVYGQKPDPYLTSLIDRAVLSNLHDLHDLKRITLPADQVLQSQTVQRLLKDHKIDPSWVQGVQIQLFPGSGRPHFSVSLVYQRPDRRWPTATVFATGSFVPASRTRGSS